MKTQICIYCGADQFVVKQQLKGYAGLVKEETKQALFSTNNLPKNRNQLINEED